MAVSASSLQSLRDEASCPICLAYFQDPVMVVQCGHNFCRDCLLRSCRESTSQGRAVSCPECRAPLVPGRVRANRQLAKVVDITRRISQEAKRKREPLGGGERGERGGGGGGGGGRGGGPDPECEEHQEPLKFFCKADQALICVVCRESRAHRGHAVAPSQEAAEEYKDWVQGNIDVLRKRREEIVKFKNNSRLEGQSFLRQADAERQQLVAHFEELHEVLEEKRNILLARLQELEKGILRQRDELSAKLTDEGTSLDKLIQEMEDKRQQPDLQFLQDIESTFDKCEVGVPQVSEGLPLEIKQQIQEFSDINQFLQGVMSRFKETLLDEHQLCKEAIMLDPATAHPDLRLSKDQKSVRLQPAGQDLPDIPERFDTGTCVLGSRGFQMGRHWWEVEVEERGVWAIGVALASVRRKGTLHFNPKEGIWAVGQLQGGHYQALTTSKQHLLLTEKLRKLRVTLDYKKEEVAFLDPETQSPIFVFSSALFEGEEVFPWFWVGGLGTKLQLTL